VTAALSFAATLAARTLDVSIDLAAGQTLAILGPNGAGKSSLLNIIAGLLRPDTGHATLADRTLFRLGGAPGANPDPALPAASDPTAGDLPAGSRWLPPHRRGVSLLAQQPLLFPHLTVLDNVAFGPRSSGQSRRQSRATATHWLGEVDALDLADRKPAQLSGGQAQRIAVARALASHPALLLLDEPLAALDVGVAQDVRRMLRRVLAGRTVIFVTHDILDALTLADRVVVIHNGTIVEQGPTREVLRRPRTGFTAELTGLNLLTGAGTSATPNAVERTGTTAGLRLADGTMLTATRGAGDGILTATRGAGDGTSTATAAFATATSDPTSAPAATAIPASGAATALAVSPSAVRISLERPTASTTNVVAATIRDLDPHGDLVRVHSALLAADVPASLVVDLDLRPGLRVYFSFEQAAATIYPL
jgi:molybdate transport system ATP-binding protein